MQTAAMTTATTATTAAAKTCNWHGEILANIQYVHIKYKPKSNGNESASFYTSFTRTHIHYNIHSHWSLWVSNSFILYFRTYFFFGSDAGHFPNLDPPTKKNGIKLWASAFVWACMCHWLCSGQERACMHYNFTFSELLGKNKNLC